MTNPTKPAADTLDDDAAALHAAVADLVRVYQFRDRDRICCHDVSVTQCYALETLVESGPMRMSALAERLFLDKSTTSRVVGALVRKGYAAQRTDLSDRRVTTLRVTPQGRRLCARITADLVDQQKQLLQISIRMSGVGSCRFFVAWPGPLMPGSARACQPVATFVAPPKVVRLNAARVFSPR